MNIVHVVVPPNFLFFLQIDNHYVIEAKTPESQGRFVIELEGSSDMVRDDRVKSKSSMKAR
jgi:hypothetical protein